MVRVRLYAHNDGDPENAIDLVQIGETAGEACLGLLRQSQELFELAEQSDIWEGLGEIVSGESEWKREDFSTPEWNFTLTAEFGYDVQPCPECPICAAQRAAGDSSTGRA